MYNLPKVTASINPFSINEVAYSGVNFPFPIIVPLNSGLINSNTFYISDFDDGYP